MRFDQHLSQWARWAATFIAAYVIAVWILGVADAAALVARAGNEHRLSLIELLLLPFISLRLSPLLHVTLVGAGILYIALWLCVPAVFVRTRTALVCLPLGLIASGTARAAKNLPLFTRSSWLEATVWLAVVAAPIAFVGLGLLLASAEQTRRWMVRTCLVVLALALAAFVFVFGLTEAVMARIPGTALSLTALTYLTAYLLRRVPQPKTLAGVLALVVTLASAYAAFLPTARSTKALAIIAHKTQLLQALLFTELAVFSPPPTLPECTNSRFARPEPPEQSRSHNVLLITLDALRADHMAAYGYDTVTMPNAEALLRESVVFETAYSAAPATAGSLTAMWTGSSAYTMRALGHWPKTLHERLRELGYRVLGSDLTRIASSSTPGSAATRLWDEPINHPVRATKLVDLLIEQIRATEGPFFAVAHFHETHDEAARQYVPKVFPPRHLSRYDDSMFEIDRHIGRLLTALRASGRYDSTVIAFSSDHGEFFGEHARYHHGSLLYEPVVRIPFAIKLPDGTPRREATFVSGFDVAPTVFKAATGRPWPVPTLGRDVFAEIAAGRRDRAVFMENVSGEHGVRRVVAVRKGPFKYTLLRGTRVEELFDLERDPDELENLAGENSVMLHAMRKELDTFLHAQACELRAVQTSEQRGGTPVVPPNAQSAAPARRR